MNMHISEPFGAIGLAIGQAEFLKANGFNVAVVEIADRDSKAFFWK